MTKESNQFDKPKAIQKNIIQIIKPHIDKQYFFQLIPIAIPSSNDEERRLLRKRNIDNPKEIEIPHNYTNKYLYKAIDALTKETKKLYFSDKLLLHPKHRLKINRNIDLSNYFLGRQTLTQAKNRAEHLLNRYKAPVMLVISENIYKRMDKIYPNNLKHLNSLLHEANKKIFPQNIFINNYINDTMRKTTNKAVIIAYNKIYFYCSRSLPVLTVKIYKNSKKIFLRLYYDDNDMQNTMNKLRNDIKIIYNDEVIIQK